MEGYKEGEGGVRRSREREGGWRDKNERGRGGRDGGVPLRT